MLLTNNLGYPRVGPFRNTAKEFGIKEKKFIKWLLERKFLYRDNEGKLNAYAKYGESGDKLFALKDVKSDKSKASLNCMLCEKFENPCSGCLRGDDGKSKASLKCKIKACYDKKNFKYCGRCSEFPCTLIKKHSKK